MSSPAPKPVFGGRPKVVLLRGHNVSAWDLRPWSLLTDEFDVSCLITASNEFATTGLDLNLTHVQARRDRFPDNRAGRAGAYAFGDRYLNLEEHLRGADIVHSADLATWFSAQAAGLRARLGFKLVVTVWETIPFLGAYRWPRERRYREHTLAAADLFLPASERACRTLALEGVQPEKAIVSYPGIDTTRFSAQAPAMGGDAAHVIISPGRLVWEKGHQDVIRAVAALRSGMLGEAPDVKLIVVGSGPEEAKLRKHAGELGLDAHVEFTSVPYDEMPGLFQRASGMVLASLPRAGWEEQFGMVLAEGLASRTAIVAARSGAIPEVLGPDAQLVEVGDWFGIAEALLAGPLSRPPGARVAVDPARIERYSLPAAAERIAAAYRTLI